MLGDYITEGVQEPKLDKFHIGLFEISSINWTLDSRPIFCSIDSKIIISDIVIGAYFIGIIGQIECTLNCSSSLNKILLWEISLIKILLVVFSDISSLFIPAGLPPA